jgi:TfoX/Sxy family transcriptional regulator of competence genes
MAFDESLAKRVRRLLRGDYAVKEKRMFGGLAFLVNGHMCCGIVSSDLVVRTGADAQAEALSQPHARPMNFTGRPMRGFVYIGPPGCQSAPQLGAWIQRGLRFVLSLPPR